MKPLKLNSISITPLASIISIILISPLLSVLTYANNTDTDITKMCNRQSLITVTKIRNNSTNELTEQDIRMIRLGATNACIDTYKRIANAEHSSDKKVVVNTVADENEDDSNKSESIIDRLLRTEKKEDVNPMQKKHRTGGK